MHLNHIYDAIRQCRTLHPNIAPALQAMVGFATQHPLGEGVWTGLLTEPAQQILATYPELNTLITARGYSKLIQYLRLFAAATIDIYSTRTQILQEIVEAPRNPFNYNRINDIAATYANSITARDTVIGIEPTDYLDERGLPIGRTGLYRRPDKLRRTDTLNRNTSEALRQGYSLHNTKRKKSAILRQHQGHLNTDRSMTQSKASSGSCSQPVMQQHLLKRCKHQLTVDNIYQRINNNVDSNQSVFNTQLITHAHSHPPRGHSSSQSSYAQPPQPPNLPDIDLHGREEDVHRHIRPLSTDNDSDNIANNTAQPTTPPPRAGVG
jgi:hypothetical protein